MLSWPEDLLRHKECMILYTSLYLGGSKNIDEATFWLRYFENRLLSFLLILSAKFLPTDTKYSLNFSAIAKLSLIS